MLFSSSQSIPLLLLVLMISIHSGLQHHVTKVHYDLFSETQCCNDFSKFRWSWLSTSQHWNISYSGWNHATAIVLLSVSTG